MAKKLLINYVLEYLLFAVFPIPAVPVAASPPPPPGVLPYKGYIGICRGIG